MWDFGVDKTVYQTKYNLFLLRSCVRKTCRPAKALIATNSDAEKRGEDNYKLFESKFKTLSQVSILHGMLKLCFFLSRVRLELSCE